MEAVTLRTKRENKGHYVPGMISNGMLYISGQLSLDPDTGKVAEGGIRVHMQQALENMDAVLREAGLTRENVVQCRIYLVGMDNWDAANEEYAAFFGAHCPARIIVSVNELHFGCLVEIEAVAECTQKGEFL